MPASNSPQHIRRVWFTSLKRLEDGVAVVQTVEAGDQRRRGKGSEKPAAAVGPWGRDPMYQANRKGQDLMCMAELLQLYVASTRHSGRGSPELDKRCASRPQCFILKRVFKATVMEKGSS